MTLITVGCDVGKLTVTDDNLKKLSDSASSIIKNPSLPDSSINNSIIPDLDLAASKIELASTEAPIADGKTPLALTISLISKSGKHIADAQPQLNAIKADGNSFICAKSDNLGIAQCSFFSVKAGDKVINLENPRLANPLSVVFYEPRSKAQAVVVYSGVEANSSSKAVIELTLHNDQGLPRAGVIPSAIVKGEGLNLITCLPSNNDGISQCQITSSLAGAKTVVFSDPLIKPLQLEFITSSFIISSNRGFVSSDGSNSISFKVLLRDSTNNPITNTTPTLSYSPSSDSTQNVHCTPSDSQGYSNCTISSDIPGRKIIEVTNPAGINEALELVFANQENTAEISSGAEGNLIANGLYQVPLNVTLKDSSGSPSVGVVPLAHASNGDATIICQASNSLGIATCTVTSTNPGLTQIFFDEPAVKAPLSLTFSAAPVVVLKNQVPSDGKTPAIIHVDTGDKVGFTPVIEIQGPKDTNATYVCLPSVTTSSSTSASSKCFITSDISGEYKLTVTQPLNKEIAINFTDSHSTLELVSTPSSAESGSTSVTGYLAKANGTDNIELKVTVKDASGAPISEFTPLLTIIGSGINNYVCSATSSDGVAICRITSRTEGLKIIKVTSPAIAQSLGVMFISPNTTIDLATTQSVAMTDPSSAAIVHITIKDSNGLPREGVIPTLNISQGSFKCFPSDQNGDARCEIRSMIAGSIQFQVIDPMISTPITVTFKSNKETCVAAHATLAEKTWSGPALTDWSPCNIRTCSMNYTLSQNECVANTRVCYPMPIGALSGTQIWERNQVGTWSECTISQCKTHYTLLGTSAGNSCVADTLSCGATELPANASSGLKTWTENGWGTCKATICNYPYKPANGMCVSAQTSPNNGVIDFTAVTNAVPSQTHNSNEVLLVGLDIPVPIIITGGINAHIETKRGPVTSWTVQGSSYSDLQNNDLVRIVANASSTTTTSSSVSIDIGTLRGLEFRITTMTSVPPSSPILTHIANSKNFSIRWGSGGIGNGGAGGCSLQYLKDNATWTDLNVTAFNCDSTLNPVDLSLPGDLWTNNFGSGVSMRVINQLTRNEIFQFSQKLSCSPLTILPGIDNPNVDENCDGLWTNDADITPPTGGAFQVAATTGGITNTPNVTLNITCPTDQSGSVQMAFGTSNSPSNWTTCMSSTPFGLSSGDGVKNIYMLFRDAYNNTTALAVMSSVTLDQSAPQGGSFVIANGSKTKSTNLNLAITCPTDVTGMVKMAFSFNPGPTNWTDCSSTASLTTPTSADGIYKVYLTFKDNLGNTASDLQQSITLDNSAPVPTISIGSGWINTNSTFVTVNAGDAQNSLPLSCTIERSESSISVTNPSGWQTVQTNSCQSFMDSSLQSGKTYSYRVTAQDSLGNTSTSVISSNWISVDQTAPSIASVTSGSSACGTIQITVNGATDNGQSGLNSLPYSFDGGANWQASNIYAYSGTSLSIPASNIKVRDLAGNVYSYASSVSGSASACFTYSWYVGTWQTAPLNPVSNWTYSGTTACSATCGGGIQTVQYYCQPAYQTQTRSTYCQRSDGTVVADSFCGGTNPYQSTQQYYQTSCAGSNPSYPQSCNTQACVNPETACTNRGGFFTDPADWSAYDSRYPNLQYCCNTNQTPVDSYLTGAGWSWHGTLPAGSYGSGTKGSCNIAYSRSCTSSQPCSVPVTRVVPTWGPQSNTPFNAGTSYTNYPWAGLCYSWTTKVCNGSATEPANCVIGYNYSTDFDQSGHACPVKHWSSLDTPHNSCISNTDWSILNLNSYYPSSGATCSYSNSTYGSIGYTGTCAPGGTYCNCAGTYSGIDNAGKQCCINFQTWSCQ